MSAVRHLISGLLLTVPAGATLLAANPQTPDFNADLLQHLPPTVGEWISLEGMAFAETAQNLGLNWPAAHQAFTSEKLQALQESTTILRIEIIEPDGETRLWGWLENLSQPGHDHLLVLVVHSPQGGTYHSTSFFRIYPGHDDFGRYPVTSEKGKNQHEH